MRRFITLGIVLAAALAVAACGEDTSSPTPAPMADGAATSAPAPTDVPAPTPTSAQTADGAATVTPSLCFSLKRYRETTLDLSNSPLATGRDSIQAVMSLALHLTAAGPILTGLGNSPLCIIL